MIANLVTTCLLALGVATGNVSSNVYKGGNAFKHEAKKPIQKAIQQISIDETYTKKGDTYTYTSGSNQFAVSKYAITNSNNNNYVYYNDYLNIANTTYVYYRNNGVGEHEIYQFIDITNYYNASITISITNTLYYVGQTGSTTIYAIYKDYTNINENYINKTLNSSLKSQLNSILNRATATGSSYTGTETTATNQKTLSIQWTLQENQILKLMYYFSRSSSTTCQSLAPTRFTLTGTADVVPVNYEVVDIPNLMFTILTLPFAWYSTAFNLTIFPNTPYQINFGNIMLTIIAALILLYLIKKVLK